MVLRARASLLPKNGKRKGCAKESDSDARSINSDRDGGLPNAEVARLERLFRDRLVNGILCQARLEWQDFDIEAFLSLLETANLETACRKAPDAWELAQPLGPAEQRDADQRRKARDRERRKAYERMKCEMTLLAEILKILGAPAENIKIKGLVSVIEEAKSHPNGKFASRVYKRKPPSDVVHAYPEVLREGRSLVFDDKPAWLGGVAGKNATGARGGSSGGGLGLDVPYGNEFPELQGDELDNHGKIRLIGEEER